MTTEQVVQHNIAVLREVAKHAADGVPVPRDTFVYGFVLGAALALRAPVTARALRADIESRLAQDEQFSAEEVEVYIRNIVDLFDRSQDQ